MFAVVKFTEENSIEAVPEIWIINDTTCYWPLGKVGKALRDLSPPDDSWEKYKAKVYVRNIKTYKEARRKATALCISSDFGELEEEPSRKRKSKKPNRYISSSGTESDLDNVIDENEQRSNAHVQSVQSRSVQHKLPTPPSGLLDANHSKWIGSKRSMGTTIATPGSSGISSDIVQSGTLRQASGAGLNLLHSLDQLDELPLRECMEKLLRIQAQTLKEVTEVKLAVMSLVEKQNAKAHAFNEEERRNICLWGMPEIPIGEMMELKVLEGFVAESADNKLKLVATLKRVGGRKIDQLIRGMLKKLFTYDLAAKFSLRGLRGKEAFSSLHIYQILLFAARDTEQFHTVTDAEMNHIISDWLKYAPDRAKSGRKPNPKLNRSQEIDDSETNEQ